MLTIKSNSRPAAEDVAITNPIRNVLCRTLSKYIGTVYAISASPSVINIIKMAKELKGLTTAFGNPGLFKMDGSFVADLIC